MFATHISREHLSDGSFVYRVALVDDNQVMAEFNGTSEKDTEALAEKIMGALEKHALIELHNKRIIYRY